MSRFLITLSAALLALWTTAAHPAPAAIPGPGPDPLEGPWGVYEGVESRSGGFEFGPGIDRRWGQAQFRRMVEGVSFDPDSREAPAGMAPSGQFTFRFDPLTRALTLTPETGRPQIFYLKYKEERPSNLGSETQQMLPFLCIFHDPLGRRAFKLIRQDAVVANTGRILIPHEDPIAGTWLLLPGTPSRALSGYYDFGLRPDPFAPLPRLTISPDHSAMLTAGAKSARFRLRQTDPSHWTIFAENDPTRPVGTMTIETKAAALVGPGVHVTRWRLQGVPDTMTAVLRDQGKRNESPHVALIRVEGSRLLNFDALAAALAKSPAGAAPTP